MLTVQLRPVLWATTEEIVPAKLEFESHCTITITPILIKYARA
jgi:hypothetical protein